MKALTAARSLAARVGSRLVTSPTSHEPPLVLVFSDDQAIQLELFLRSFGQHVLPPLPLTVIYRASSDSHRQAYEQVFAGYGASELTPVAQGDFKQDLLVAMKASSARHVVFFGSEVVFLHPVDTRLMEQWDAREGILSLRLGRNITRHDRQTRQPLPASFESAPLGDQPLARWRWSAGELDWAHPTSLDGHLLPLPDLVPVVEEAHFDAPASLERAIDQYAFLFRHRWGYCWERARILHLHLDASGDSPDSEQLLLAFLGGLRLDVADLPAESHDCCRLPWRPSLRPADELGANGG